MPRIKKLKKSKGEVKTFFTRDLIEGAKPMVNFHRFGLVKNEKEGEMMTEFSIEVKANGIPKLDEAVKWILEFEKLHPERKLSVKIELF